MDEDNERAWQGASPRAFLKVAQAADLLGLSQVTVRRLCRSGALPALRCGREWRVERVAVQKLKSGRAGLTGLVAGGAPPEGEVKAEYHRSASAELQ